MRRKSAIKSKQTRFLGGRSRLSWRHCQFSRRQIPKFLAAELIFLATEIELLGGRTYQGGISRSF
jgi:hypothetical protein